MAARLSFAVLVNAVKRFVQLQFMFEMNDVSCAGSCWEGNVKILKRLKRRNDLSSHMLTLVLSFYETRHKRLIGENAGLTT